MAISTWISMLDVYSFVQVDSLRMALQWCNMSCILWFVLYWAHLLV